MYNHLTNKEPPFPGAFLYPAESCLMARHRTPPHLVTLILLSGFSPLTLNMFLPSLGNMAADLGTGTATLVWAVSGYLAVTAVLQLVIGPLSDRIGRRRVLLAALAIFTIGSVGCVLAQDVWTFLIFRILQGGASAGYTLSMAIVRDTRDEAEAVSLIGYIGMAMAIGPLLGPMIGGLMDTWLGWRSIFVFYCLYGAGLLLLCWHDLGETSDLRGRGAERPPLRELLSEPAFWAYALCSAFSVGGFYIFLTGTPIVASGSFGITAATLGFFLGSITIGFMAGGFLAGRFGARIGVVKTILTGRIAACVGVLVGLVLFLAGVLSPVVFVASAICVGLGNGISMPGSNTGAMSVRPALAGSAAGLSGAMIVGGGAVMTAITGFVVPEEGGAVAVLGLMFLSTVAALICALWAAALAARPRART